MFPAITPPPSMVLAEQRLSAGLSAAPPGEQFTDSFVKGFGYNLGVATTGRCSAVSTGMMMTITITMTTTATAITRIMAITSILM